MPEHEGHHINYMALKYFKTEVNKVKHKNDLDNLPDYILSNVSKKYYSINF